VHAPIGLLYFVLAAYGITQIVVYGSIFNAIRPTKGKLGEFFRCPMCVGFWVGVILWVFNRDTELFTFEYTFANLFILGGIASGASYLLTMLVGDDGLKVDKTQGGQNEH
tara:strand:+ start:255 stop:584 length:330 start_codon:yes stop_codon:yes gene_type:complete